MFTSEEVADVTPLLRFSESDKAPPHEPVVELTDKNLGIGLLIPASNGDNSILFEDRVEDAKGVDLSGGPPDAVVGKLEANGFLELGLGRHRIVVDVQVAKLYGRRRFNPADIRPRAAPLSRAAHSSALFQIRCTPARRSGCQEATATEPPVSRTGLYSRIENN